MPAAEPCDPEGQPAEHATAREILAERTARLLVIPGNHDQRSAFRASVHDHTCLYLPREGPLSYEDDASGPVCVIALDVTAPGFHHGELDEHALTLPSTA